MKHFRVSVVVKTLEVYRVETENEEDALEFWADRTLIHTDDGALENEIFQIEECNAPIPLLKSKRS